MTIAHALANRLSESESERDFARIHHYYVPLLHWIEDQVLRARKVREEASRPLLIGLCGPQGSGKTTLSRFMIELAPLIGLRGASLSIDDFYLTREEQLSLAHEHEQNPYLQQRGYPGTHDIRLGNETLDKLILLTTGTSLQLPAYDKSLHQGQGDRLPHQNWPVIRGPLDFVILEGWMLGFRPAKEDSLPNKNFQLINHLLAAYESWTSRLDSFVLLEPLRTDFALQWRIEAEEKMKALGKTGMSREEVSAYIAKFLLAYETYLPPLAHQLPRPLDHAVKLLLAINRCPL